jgi:hypothetical protein
VRAIKPPPFSFPGRYSLSGLPFGVLEALTGFFTAVFLALFRALIACEETAAFEDFPQIGVRFEQGAGYAVPDGARLAGSSATPDIDVDVEPVEGVGDFERLADDHPGYFPGEIILDLLGVDDNDACAWFHSNLGAGFLAATCRGVYWLSFHAIIRPLVVSAFGLHGDVLGRSKF